MTDYSETIRRKQLERLELCTEQRLAVRRALLALRDDLDQDDSIESFQMPGNMFWLEARREAWFQVTIVHEDWNFTGWAHVFEPLAKFDHMFGSPDPTDAYGLRTAETVDQIIRELW